jgi:cation transporter-like permease
VEYQRLYNKDTRFGFSRLERTLIIIFMVAYLLATAGIALVTYLISIHSIGAVSL